MKSEMRRRVEAVVGQVDVWDEREKYIKFRCYEPMSLKRLTALSEALGTDRINFNFGESGSPGYSTYTPGSSGEPGWVEIFLD